MLRDEGDHATATASQDDTQGHAQHAYPSLLLPILCVLVIWKLSNGTPSQQHVDSSSSAVRYIVSAASTDGTWASIAIDLLSSETGEMNDLDMGQGLGEFAEHARSSSAL